MLDVCSAFGLGAHNFVLVTNFANTYISIHDKYSMVKIKIENLLYITEKALASLFKNDITLIVEVGEKHFHSTIFASLMRLS